MKNEDLLPPIIKDLIDTLRKDGKENRQSVPMHVRDNVCGRLENIVACSNEAIATFRVAQTRYNTIKAKQKA